MAVSTKQQRILDFLSGQTEPLGLPTILSGLTAAEPDLPPIPERTLRRQLGELVAQGRVQRSGQKRGTRYWVQAGYTIASPDGEYRVQHFKFLDAVPKHRRPLLLAHLRDLWSHTSTALEGNTLSLGDTHFLLEEGLTVSGKPLREHQEILGHARAIELLYARVYKTDTNIDKDFLFDLHNAVQTERVTDIYKPSGAWKVEPNGVYARSEQGEQLFIEFTAPQDVDTLMQEVIEYINRIDLNKVKLINAPAYYAKVHCGITQIHPFWDGNGRIARLVANLLLLKAGLPPLLIDANKRREYLEILSAYSLTSRQLTPHTGVWPDADALNPFIAFCASCYEQSKALVEKAKEYSEE